MRYVLAREKNRLNSRYMIYEQISEESHSHYATYKVMNTKGMYIAADDRGSYLYDFVENELIIFSSIKLDCKLIKLVTS